MGPERRSAAAPPGHPRSAGTPRSAGPRTTRRCTASAARRRHSRSARSSTRHPCEIIEVDILKGESRTAEFLKINPNGRTPVLDDNGFILAESNAILAYLARGTKFLPRRPQKIRPDFPVDVLRAIQPRAVHRHIAILACSTNPIRQKEQRCSRPSATAVGPRSKSWKHISPKMIFSSATTPSPTSHCSHIRMSPTKAAFRWIEFPKHPRDGSNA